mgnify:CR=1 FL=1
MKIYTKKGDTGYTLLLRGGYVPKNDPFVEAYGTLDELNSFTGLLKTTIKNEEIKTQLTFIQKSIFEISTFIACGEKMNEEEFKNIKIPEPEILEKWIDRFEAELPPLKNFILPGGSMESSLAHVCRCICRRAERKLVPLLFLETVKNRIFPFLNR